MSFKFKQFEIKQKDNAHKVGTDSMLLGAWTEGHFSKILDIGTGTGILALMIAQKMPEAEVIGIEPNEVSCNEAKENYHNSPFSGRLKAICSKLQDYNYPELFDLIIANPPYFVDSFLSTDNSKNAARHTINLNIEDLYRNVRRLLSEKGQFNVVFPSDVLQSHLREASKNGFFPCETLIIENDQLEPIRHLISFKKEVSSLVEKRMIVKYSNGLYSESYVHLTKDFHNKALQFHKL